MPVFTFDDLRVSEGTNSLWTKMSSIPHRAKFRTADSPFAASKHSCSGDSDRESNAFTDVAGGHFADLRVSRPRDLERRGKFIDNTCPVGSSASATSTSVSLRSKTSRSSAGPAARRSWCRLSFRYPCWKNVRTGA